MTDEVESRILILQAENELQITITAASKLVLRSGRVGPQSESPPHPTQAHRWYRSALLRWPIPPPIAAFMSRRQARGGDDAQNQPEASKIAGALLPKVRAFS
ncbi:hypothetical protein [Mycolicibacterium agri]|uniref:Uncharacterized protein n=1 Tax=Mycolicibacterium agri TaxID=36811 RepID=A0A7I9WE27_MYCAG|nr:hypothetical protein [Mycolicibacterium agri]GFG55516.1 hypothetical protein MAGR_69570 [Mycolicibacterium agri]